MTTIDEWRRASRLGAQSRLALIHRAVGEPVYTVCGVDIVVLPGMEYGVVIVEQPAVYVSSETWATLRHGGSGDFIQAFAHSQASNGSKWLSAIDWWNAARRRQADEERTSVAASKDEITLLTERVTSLLMSVASTEDASVSQRSELYGRLLGLRDDVAQADTRLKKLHSMVELAELVIGDV